MNKGTYARSLALVAALVPMLAGCPDDDKKPGTADASPATSPAVASVTAPREVADAAPLAVEKDAGVVDAKADAGKSEPKKK